MYVLIFFCLGKVSYPFSTYIHTDASHPVVLHHFHYCCCSKLRPWTRRWLFKPAADLHGRWQTWQMNPSDMTGFTELENGIVFLWMTICRFRPAVVLHFFEHITQVVSAGREGSRFAYPRSFSCDFLWLTHTCIHTYIHTYLHTYIHKYIYLIKQVKLHEMAAEGWCGPALKQIK